MHSLIDLQFMQQALTLAQAAQSRGEVPIGAVLVKNDEIIGTGYNQPIATQDPTAHAEIVALRCAAKQVQNYRLPETTLYVTLEPCSMCIGAITHARIARLVFGASDPKKGAIQSLPHRIKREGGVMAEACGDLLKNFFREKRA